MYFTKLERTRKKTRGFVENFLCEGKKEGHDVVYTIGLSKEVHGDLGGDTHSFEKVTKGERAPALDNANIPTPSKNF